ncbi:MAG: DUF58 domain-containing protein, partial [Verrucomicrobiota bacterium]
SLSREQIYQWLHRLRTFRFDEETTLTERVAQLLTRLTSASLVIVLSDLHDAGAVGTLKRLGQRHDVVVIQLSDPAENALEGAGLVRAREAETGREFVTRGRGEWLDQATVDAELKRGALDHVLVRTDESFAHRLRHFFQARGVIGRGER